MSATQSDALVTDETQHIEKVFRDFGYADVQSYRLGPYSVRLRVRDARFAGMSRVARMQHLAPLIRALPEETQQDMIFVLPIAPGEELQGQFQRMNTEFENPRQDL